MNVASEVKECCAALYGSAAAQFLLGDRFHPGGAALTSRLGRMLRLESGCLLLDVASGRGASALQLAREAECDVVGVDLSEENVAAATAAARAAGFDGRLRFIRGDAEALPLPDLAADAALCECAFCTFPDKPTAAAELARVLRPGGRLALADVVAEPERLPAELLDGAAWIACVGGALPLPQIEALLAAAGFEPEVRERHDDALAELLARVDGRLDAARLLAPQLAELVARAKELVAAATAAVESGALGYGVVVARLV